MTLPGRTVLVLGAFVGILLVGFTIAITVNRRKRKNQHQDGGKSTRDESRGGKAGAVDDNGEQDEDGPTETPFKSYESDKSLTSLGSLVKVKLSCVNGDYDDDDDDDFSSVPQPPPPTRNTSSLDLGRVQDNSDDEAYINETIPEDEDNYEDSDDDEDEDDDGRERKHAKTKTKTPPPSRNPSTANLADMDDYVNEIQDEESSSLLLPPGGIDSKHSAGRSKNKSMGSSKNSAILGREVAAAVSLSLGAQGYEITTDYNNDDNYDDANDDVSASDATEFSYLNSPELSGTFDRSDFSFVNSDGLSHSSQGVLSFRGDQSMGGASNGIEHLNSLPSEGANSMNGSSSVSDHSTPASKEAIQETFETLERGLDKMTLENAGVLSSLVNASSEEKLLEQVVVYIGNSAAFSRNQVLLRESGCLNRLSGLLKAHSMALRVGQTVSYPSIVTKVISTVNNLAANEENQKHLQDCLPALFEFATSPSCPESVQLSALQALTNLSVMDGFQKPYTQIIQALYESLDASPTTPLQMQAIKVLVNLSANPNMVPHLLAAKAPGCLLALLVSDAGEDVVLRWITFLANVMVTTHDRSITATMLPTEYKAPSPETMYTALYGLNNQVKLRSKVFILSKNSNPEIQHHASRIYGCLT